MDLKSVASENHDSLKQHLYRSSIQFDIVYFMLLEKESVNLRMQDLPW